MAVYSRSFLQNVNNWRFWIRKKQYQDSERLIDEIYLYAKYLNGLKYQFLIKKCEDAGIKHLNDCRILTIYR